MSISDEPQSGNAARLHQIASGLAAIGLVTRLHRTRAGTDLTATMHVRGHRDIQVIVDEDGYTELRYWASLTIAPTAAAATIANVLKMLTAPQSLASRVEPTCEPVAGYDGAVTERAEGSGMTRPQDHLTDQGRIPGHTQQRPPDSPHEPQVRPDDLQARLERLPSNHPSSPYRDDGSRKPPPPDLAKYELPLPDEPGFKEQDLADNIEPLSDAEYAEHIREVRDRLEQARAEGLESDRQYTIDPDHEVWSGDRIAIHDQIIDQIYARAQDVPNEHRAVIAGGLPGAGKTTILDGHTGIDRSRFLTIDPDEIKKELAHRGLVPQIEGLSPMEASSLVHEESSHIARQLAYRAQSVGKNLIWDITMSSRPTTERRIDDLRSAGYSHIEGIFVEIPLETSQARAEARHRIGHDEYRIGKGIGGRLVPPEVTYEKSDSTWGSINRRTFEEVKHRFDTWSVYDNSTDGGSPVLVDSAEKRKPNEQ